MNTYTDFHFSPRGPAVLPNQPITSIVIVGGGTAGWSAAACLARFLAKRRTSITLVESSAIGTVGVGEASVPNIHNFNAYVGLAEPDFLSSTLGTFKLGIRFDDWRDLGASFFHPFGPYGVRFEDMDFHQCLAKARELGDESSLSDYSLPIALARAGRFAQPLMDPRSPLTQYGYAYHFDAGLYAQRLKKLALERGVVHLDRRIVDVELTESGDIRQVRFDAGSTLAGDFFVDCSGFRALLIEGALKTGYESWREWLPCDAAVAMPCGRPAGNVDPYTVATALGAGWSWRIPLQHRCGNGYVYSRDFLSDEGASVALAARLSSAPAATPNYQRFTAGMRKRFWNRNCIALGLAGGFIEPLESTSINLVHRALSVFMDYYPDRQIDPRRAAAANRHFELEQRHIRDFIILHYKLTRRSDTEFWRHVAAMPIPESLQHRIDTFRACGSLLQFDADSFKPESWLTMYEGFAVPQESCDSRVNDIDIPRMRSALGVIRGSIRRAAEQALRHDDFLSKVVLAPRVQ
jgi:tryptophan 7-halogenase